MKWQTRYCPFKSPEWQKNQHVGQGELKELQRVTAKKETLLLKQLLISPQIWPSWITGKKKVMRSPLPVLHKPWTICASQFRCTPHYSDLKSEIISWTKYHLSSTSQFYNFVLVDPLVVFYIWIFWYTWTRRFSLNVEMKTVKSEKHRWSPNRAGPRAAQLETNPKTRWCEKRPEGISIYYSAGSFQRSALLSLHQTHSRHVCYSHACDKDLLFNQTIKLT